MGGAVATRDAGLAFHRSSVWKFALFDGGTSHWWANFANNGYPSITPWYCVSAEFVGAFGLIPGICTRWAALYKLPLIAGATQFWAVRKGFFFTGAGAELPVTWSPLLIVQILLGDGPYAVVPSMMVRTSGVSPAEQGSNG
jgi:putative oxidoreductase